MHRLGLKLAPARWSLLAAILTACVGGPRFMKSKGTEVGSSDGIKAKVQLDQGGVVTAAISANTSLAQTVSASSSNSAISQASVTFPPGALAISTSVTIEQGSSLAAGSFANALGLSSGNSVSAAGSAVVVSAASQVNAVTPFTVAIPLGNSGSLLDGDPSLLVVIYKVWHADTSTVEIGIIPHSELVISANTLQFATLYFGQYQAAYTTAPVVARVNTISTTQILTKAAENMLAKIAWQGIAASFNIAQRSLTVTATATGFTSIASCSLALSQTTTTPYDLTAPFGNALSGSVALGTLASGLYHASISCSETNGRVSTSPWSDGLTIAAAQTAPAPAPTPTPAATTTPAAAVAPHVTTLTPADGAVGVPGNAVVSATFDAPLTVNATQAAQALRVVIDNTDNATAAQLATLPSFPGTVSQPVANQIAYTPSGSYPLLTKMTAQLGAGLLGTNGVATTATKQWSFMSRDGDWNPASAATTALVPATTPDLYSVAYGSGGDVLGLRFDSGSTLLVAHYLAIGATSWQITTLDSTHTIGTTQALVDPSGTAYVLWTATSGSTTTLNVSKMSKTASTWATTAVDTCSGSCLIDKPVMAFYGDGYLRLAWFIRNSGQGQIKTALLPKGAALSTAAPLAGSYTSPITSAPQLSLAVNTFGDFLVAWIPYTGQGLYAAYSLAHNQDATTSNPDVLDSSGDSLANLHLGIDGLGNGTILFSKLSTANTYSQLIATYRAFPATWMPVNVANNALTSSYPIVAASLAVGTAGLSRLVWLDQMFGIQATSAINGLWQPTVTAIDNIAADYGNTSHLLLATDDQGDAAVVWDDGYYVYHGCNLSAATPATTCAQNISPATSKQFYNLSLVMDGSGNATVLARDPATMTSIYTSRIARAQSNWPALTVLTSSTDSSFHLWSATSSALGVDLSGRLYYVTSETTASVPTISLHLFN